MKKAILSIFMVLLVAAGIGGFYFLMFPPLPSSGNPAQTADVSAPDTSTAASVSDAITQAIADDSVAVSPSTTTDITPAAPAVTAPVFDPKLQKGQMYVTVTSSNPGVENVTALNLTVDKVELFSQAQGWITLLQTSKTVNLLDLKNSNFISRIISLAAATVASDTYTRLRLHIPKVTVTPAQSKVAQEAQMPSQNFEMAIDIKVNPISKSMAQFDITPSKSLQKTADGHFIFAPVVKVISGSDMSINANSSGFVTVYGGLVNPTINVHMDANGAVSSDAVK